VLINDWGGSQGGWANVPSLTGFSFDGFPNANFEIIFGPEIIFKEKIKTFFYDFLKINILGVLLSLLFTKKY
jgi:hypothetical protein